MVLSRPPGFARAAVAQEDLLAEARERIGRYRQGSGTITVRGADRQPLAGIRVRLEQTRHAFRFGCNLFRWGRVGDASREETYRHCFAELLNYATLGFYWGAYEPRPGQPQYAYTDEVLTWCHQQEIQVKGHPLAWDHPASSPRWLPSNTMEIQRLSTVRVREIVRRFQGRIDVWDVVNEPTDLTRFHNPMNTWAGQMGAVPFTKLHLDAARQTNPGAILLVNDYRTDPAFYRILDQLRNVAGKPLFDAVGIQSHMHGGGWPLTKIWEVCDAYAKLDLPIHFTEATVVSGPRAPQGGEHWLDTTAEGEAKQAEYVPKFYTMLFAHPAVEALTWWDFADDGAWQGAPAGWLRKDMSPKPVYDELKRRIKGEWWTRTEGRTDARGEFGTRAFFGTYRVTAVLPDGQTIEKTFDWKRGQPNRFELATP